MKKRRSPKSQLALARSFQRSELSRAEFSQKVGVHPSTVKRWCQLLRDTKGPELTTAEFAEVTVVETPSSKCKPDVEVTLPFGVTLRFFGVQ